MSKANVLLLSEEGILTLANKPFSAPLQGRAVVAGDVFEKQLAIIVDNHEVWTFIEKQWRHVASSDIKLNCIHWTDGQRLLLGSESARLAWLSNGELDFIESFDNVPDRHLWMTPWGGPPDVRSLAVSKDGTIYANIHVGWIVRSQDGGKTWKTLRNGLEMDVHQVAVHPSDPATVFAVTADGFYLSKNHGETFSRLNNGVPYLYERACACFPEKDVYLLSTSTGPYEPADARLYRSEDQGKNWHLVNGLPEKISKNINTFQVAVTGAGHAVVVVEDTVLYESHDYGLHWKKLAEGYPKLYGCLVME